VKKIAIVIFDITKYGGTERAVSNLANLLAESKKYSVSIVSIHSVSGKAAYATNTDICLYHLGLIHYNTKILRLHLYWKIIEKLNWLCKEKNIDVVFGTTHAINIMLYFLLKIVKTIACEHVQYVVAPLSSRLIRKIIYPYLDVIVVLTLSDKKYYYFHDNVSVIPNSLSFQPSRQSELTNKTILAVGRLTYEKGFDLLIDAVSLIKFKCNGWNIKIIGSGENESELKKKIQFQGLGDIIKIYPATDAIMQEYLEASIFVLSSRYEGFGLVLIEAQSCGLPIVSFNCPGPAEIIHHNEDGLLIKKRDINKFSEALLELMRNSEKRIQFGKKALQNVAKYKPENVFVLWDKLLDTL